MLGVPRVESSTSALKLPDGWGVELPEAVHAKSAYATYDETYRFENGTLYAERRIEVLKEKVPVADWKSYKKWADTVDLGNEPYVQLTRTGKTASRDAADKGPPVITETNAKAATLIASAYKAVQQHELDSAESMLDQGKNLNAQQSWLWLTYGYLEFQRGQISAAIEDYKKELSLHPDQYGAYSPLAQAQVILGQRDEAKKTLQQWASVEENNPAPSSWLVSMLLEDKDAAAAVKAAESAIARLPEEKKKDETLQLQLGRAQLMAGMKEKGRATLLAVLQTTQSPEVMNDSAYELSDAHLELPIAEATTRTALTKLSEESKTWTLDENPQVLNGKSRLLVAAWDTMGWILFQEGKLDEAESYLNAAWLNGQSAEIGEHLGELLAAKGNKTAALKAYELALATIPPYDMMGVKKAPGAEEKKLKERTEALRQAGAKPSLHDPHKALTEIRTISLGSANGLNGTAEYRLLLREGKIERAEVIGLKQLEGGSERVKKAQFSGFWPAGSEANLVRNGILNCHSGVCELVLEP
jgi:tetratricopeptide (TPR) repeat protein